MRTVPQVRWPSCIHRKTGLHSRASAKFIRNMIEHYNLLLTGCFWGAAIIAFIGGVAWAGIELEKALHEGKDSPEIAGLHKMKARIEIVCDYKDLHIIDDFIKHCGDMDEKNKADR